MKRSTGLLFLLGCLVALPASAQLWDPGMAEGAVRTEYDPGLTRLHLNYRNDITGLAGAEGCLWDADIAFSGCPGRRGDADVWRGTVQLGSACRGDQAAIGESQLGCIDYRDSPYFEMNQPDDRYWVLIMNEDPSFDACNPGPPDISHPRSVPGEGLFGFDLQPVGEGHRANLEINASAHDFDCPQSAMTEVTVPFLSVGAQANRGNGGPVGELGNALGYGTVEFELDMVVNEPMQVHGDPAAVVGAHGGIYVLASWPSDDPQQTSLPISRLLFLALFTTQDYHDPTGDSIDSRWNWPIVDSMFWPGADVAYLTVHRDTCGQAIAPLQVDSLENPQTYRLDLTALFRCADARQLWETPMPEGAIAMDGVHWFVESRGTRGAVGITVSDMQMRRSITPGDFDIGDPNL